jgi:hypothetical protein
MIKRICSTILWLTSAVLVYSQESHIPSLLENGHQYGQTAFEKAYFPEIEKAFAEMDYNNQILTDDTLVSFINNILEKVKPAGLDSFPIKIVIVKTLYCNAGMYINGTMEINTGLLSVMENEAQLAMIICHELAHYIYRHGLLMFQEIEKLEKKYEKQVFRRQKAIQRDIATELSQYSISIEQEADSLGLLLYLKAGYSPAEASKSISNLPERDTISSTTFLEKIIFGIQRSLPTHPRDEDRISFLQTHTSRVPETNSTGKAEYQRLTINIIQVQLELLQRFGSNFDILNVIDTLQLLIPDTLSLYYKTLTLLKGTTYQKMLADPFTTGYYLFVADYKKQNQKEPSILEGGNKIRQQYFDAASPFLEHAAFSVLLPLINDPDMGHEANKQLGLICYHKKDYKQARFYLNACLATGKKIADARYINFILNEVNNK